MTVTITQPAPCQQKLQITVSRAAIQPLRDVVVQEFQKEAVVAGFRKGKAPRDLIERQFTEQIREETLRRLTRRTFEQVTEERKLKPVGPFEVLKMEFDEQRGLDLEAQVEVEPEFTLADYRGITVTRRPAAVSPDEIDQHLAQLRESAAQLVPGAEGGPHKEKRLPNLDDDFAKDVGFENLEQLRGHLEAKLREQKQAQARQHLEQHVGDALLQRHQFDVPPRLVTRQAERLTRDFQARLLLAGMNEEQAKQELAAYTEQLKTNAARHVKLSFILDRIAEREHATVTQDELVERLWKLARRWGKDPVEVRKLLDAQGLWPSIVASIRQDKAMSRLLDAAKIADANP